MLSIKYWDYMKKTVQSEWTTKDKTYGADIWNRKDFSITEIKQLL